VQTCMAAVRKGTVGTHARVPPMVLPGSTRGRDRRDWARVTARAVTVLPEARMPLTKSRRVE
jgi:hypothetical protein